MYISESYYDNIIKPLEKEYWRLKEKVNSKKISNFLLRQIYEEYIKLNEELLCEKYANLLEIISEDYSFTSELAESLKVIGNKLNNIESKGKHGSLTKR